MAHNRPLNVYDLLGLIDPRLSLGYKTITPPRTGDCGELDTWVIQWCFSSKVTPRGGDIIQHVNVKFNVTDCSNNPVKHPSDDGRWNYWESWPVDVGYSITTFAETGDTTDDTYNIPGAGDNTKGTVVFQNTARFYEAILLPDSFIPNNPATYAHILFSTAVNPHLNPDTATPSIPHSITLSWNCCCPNKKTQWQTSGLSSP